jgi:hypothetical protein
MTAAEQVTYMQSLMDERVSDPRAFWTDPDDYYAALTEAERKIVMELVENEEWHSLVDLILLENVADGAALTKTAIVVFSAYDPINLLPSMPTSGGMFPQFVDITLPFYSQYEIFQNELVTFPATQTLRVCYLKEPEPIGAAQDSELPVSMHRDMSERACSIMIHRDLSTPMAELIDEWRNHTELRKKAAAPKSGIDIPSIPYQNK